MLNRGCYLRLKLRGDPSPELRAGCGWTRSWSFPCASHIALGGVSSPLWTHERCGSALPTAGTENESVTLKPFFFLSNKLTTLVSSVASFKNERVNVFCASCVFLCKEVRASLLYLYLLNDLLFWANTVILLSFLCGGGGKPAHSKLPVDA